jgi:hypothetical protein
MQIRMRNAEGLTHSQITEFLKASETIGVAGQRRAEVYGWVQKTLVAREYARHGKKRRGAIRAYLSKVTGLSLAQITRLIRSYIQTGAVESKEYRRHCFAARYTRADVALLAEVDRAHERLSGPATLRIVKREYSEFGNRKFARLAEVSGPRCAADGTAATSACCANPATAFSSAPRR